MQNTHVLDEKPVGEVLQNLHIYTHTHTHAHAHARARETSRTKAHTRTRVCNTAGEFHNFLFVTCEWKNAFAQLPVFFSLFPFLLQVLPHRKGKCRDQVF